MKPSTPWSQADREAVAADLGRTPRGVVGVAARRADGRPLVVVTPPRLPSGAPFPTLYYLTDSALAAACSRLEAEHFMEKLAARLDTEPEFRQAYEAAHEDYLARRAEVGQECRTGDVPEIDGFSAGGMPTRVKCLHALVGHSLAVGPGVNPVGDAALEEIGRRRMASESLEGSPWAVSSVERRSAIDCGTNSIRLLIADVTGGPAWELEDVERDMVITRLGAGVDSTGKLAQDAIARTVEVARVYADRIRRAGAEAPRVVATSATRDASNREVFRQQMMAATGVEPEVITGSEEARLSYLGALSSLPAGLEAPFLVVDIGGGSTEFVLGGTSVEQSISVDMGSVRVTERFGPEPWTAEKTASARAWIDHVLDRVEGEVDLSRARTLVGLAGTVTSLAGWIFDVKEYSPEVTHGSVPGAQRWQEALRFFVEAPVEVKQRSAAVPAGRADVIAGGALIWERILVRLGILAEAGGGVRSGAPQVTPTLGPRADDLPVVVSEHDILDGLVMAPHP